MAWPRSAPGLRLESARRAGMNPVAEIEAEKMASIADLDARLRRLEHATVHEVELQSASLPDVAWRSNIASSPPLVGPSINLNINEGERVLVWYTYEWGVTTNSSPPGSGTGNVRLEANDGGATPYSVVRADTLGAFGGTGTNPAAGPVTWTQLTPSGVSYYTPAPGPHILRLNFNAGGSGTDNTLRAWVRNRELYVIVHRA